MRGMARSVSSPPVPQTCLAGVDPDARRRCLVVVTSRARPNPGTSRANRGRPARSSAERETNASRRAGTRAISDLGSYPSQEVGELVWVRRGELADLPRRLVPRSGSRAGLEQAEKPVKPAAPAIVSHDCGRAPANDSGNEKRRSRLSQKNDRFTFRRAGLGG
jgi:hypothetical protein